MLVFLNPTAGGGTAGHRWDALQPMLRHALRGERVELVTDRFELGLRLVSRSGIGGVLVAAGGDGTVNAAASALMELPAELRARWRLGAVGLGSSNDFHKPRPASRGVPPVLLDAERAAPRAVGQVDFFDAAGAERRAHFLVNASVGVVALGNHLFNVEDGPLRILKRRWTVGAIGYAALRAVLAGRDVPARIAVGQARWSSRLANAHVLLSPHVSGNLRYDVAVPAEHAFAIALCDALGRLHRIRTLLSLSRGRFTGRPGTRVLVATELEIDIAEPTPLETDGEVRLARALRFRHLPGALNVCA